MEKYHYVYRITNKVKNMHYYGKRSSKDLPIKDLGTKYFSSSTDEDFIALQKKDSSIFKYKIVSLHETAKQAIEKEIKLHKKFNVGSNPNFYNKVNQISRGFDATGYKFTLEQKLRASQTKMGHLCSDDTRAKISAGVKNSVYVFTENRKQHMKRLNLTIKTGVPLTESHKQKIREAQSGIKGNNAKLCNIYTYPDNNILVSNVVANEWAKNNNITGGSLRQTAYSDFLLPSSTKNRHHHKNLYIRYV